ncbi:MAG TPA: hypothetical protein VFN22_00865 [Gemmatimonadales bacterium]|nr:hypothetical protein [Gemmatimonadales bacterium]
MFGVYLFSTIVGVGLLALTLLGGSDSDIDTDLDVDIDVDIDMDADVGSHVGHLAGAADGIGEVVLGLFKPRNLTFLLAAFGTTGVLLTLAGTNAALTLILAGAMGMVSWVTSHALFTWLTRSDSSVDALGDHELVGSIGTVTLPIAPGTRGRITVIAAGRETYLTARLEAETDRTLDVGTEVLIRRTAGGVAEVIPTDTLDLPSTTS